MHDSGAVRRSVRVRTPGSGGGRAAGFRRVPTGSRSGADVTLQQGAPSPRRSWMLTPRRANRRPARPAPLRRRDGAAATDGGLHQAVGDQLLSGSGHQDLGRSGRDVAARSVCSRDRHSKPPPWLPDSGRWQLVVTPRRTASISSRSPGRSRDGALILPRGGSFGRQDLVRSAAWRAAARHCSGRTRSRWCRRRPPRGRSARGPPGWP